MRILTSAVLALTVSLSLRLDAAERLDLIIDPTCGLPRISMEGEGSENYSLEAFDDLAEALPWKPMMDLTFEEGPKSWCDSEARSRPRRFYRMIRLSAPPPEVRPRNFRLIDHTGRNRELYYDFNNPAVRAFVLLFTGTSCSNLAPHLVTLDRLVREYSGEGIRFWGVSSLMGNDRTRLIQEVGNLGINIPVLHDRAQAVAREFGVVDAPEVVVIQNGTFRVLYRGAIEESYGAAGSPQYLESALVRILAGEVPNPSRVRPVGRPAGFSQRSAPSYATQVAPVLQAKCVTCHSPGNIAPWSMTNHQVIAMFADSIKDEVLSARMPPWHADPHVGRFANDSSLTPDEVAGLVDWINAGSPRGEGVDPLENIPAEPPVWSLGTPDLVLSIPTQSLPANGVIDYRNLEVNPNLTSDKWLRAAVVRPGNRKVVHHSLVFLGDESSSLGGLAGFFAGYVPGLDPVFFPEGTGKLLPKGTPLTFQMHYISVGTPQSDQTQIGLYFHSTPPAQRLQTKSAFDIFFQIPPGSQEAVLSPEARTSAFTKAAWLYELTPHQHLRGKWFKYELLLRDGTRQLLLSVPRYVFDWQRLYRFAEPVLIPVGARIICTGAWDNSPQNLFNPNAGVRVGFGEQTFEEMFIGYYNYGELR